jgi:mannose-6-phosphate isomerase-like protein (cupin superfamily)
MRLPAMAARRRTATHWRPHPKLSEVMAPNPETAPATPRQAPATAKSANLPTRPWPRFFHMVPRFRPWNVRATQSGREFIVSESLPASVHAPVDLGGVLSRFSEHWAPKTVARLNDYEVKVVKLQGEFVWHAHRDTDELFLVIDGRLTIQLRDGDVQLNRGQLFVVPRGVEHCPLAGGEVHALLIEPADVVNTGDVAGPRTAAPDDWLA